MTSYIKSGYNGNGMLGYIRKHKRHFSRAVYVLVSLYLLFSLVYSDLGLFKYILMKHEHDSLKHDITRLDVENKSLREEVTKLKTDPDYIESIARDKLGLVKEGEKIYKYQPPHK